MTSKKSWRRTAVALAAGSLVLTLASLNPVFAQSNVTGNLFGNVSAPAGVTVVVESLSSGAKRTLTPDSTGRFVAGSMPTGSYKVTLLRDGKVVSVSEVIEVKIGQGSEVVFPTVGAQRIEVVGRLAQIDVSTVNTGATFTAKELDSLPIARNIDAIIQLAPNTARTDTRYAGGASFGGGAATENSYYINGFPVTNPLTQLGSSQLPFGAIGQAQIQTGGFGVEFGRSIGGVVNIISKSGGNRWEAGGGLSFSPASLRGKRKSIYFERPGVASTDGKLFQAREKDEVSETTVSAYVSGPIITDKLFIYAGVEKIKRDSELVVGTGGTATTENTSRLSGLSDREDITNRYLAKVDWNITDSHRVEATIMGDRYARDEERYGFDYSTLTRNDVLRSTNRFTNDAANNLGVGASTQILKYTGYLTENLTLQILTGRSKTPHPTNLAGYNPAYPLVVVGSDGEYPGFTYNNLQTVAGNIANPNYEDQVKANRFDLEYVLGKHTIRAGIDSVKLSSLDAGSASSGGRTITYASTTDTDYQSNGMLAPISASGALQSGGAYFYGTEQIFSNVSSAFSDQNAQYIEDRYQATDNLQLIFGVRNEQYKNRTTDGQTFLKVKDQLTPRFAFTWDVTGNAQTKVFGSAGRYAVQLPTTIALRGANPSTLTSQVFSYTGVAADGTPTGRVNLGPVFSTNNEYGQPKDLNSVSAQDMKPNLQDELTLGIEKALMPQLTVGARFTYRRLVSTIDDYCDTRVLSKWANDRGITDKDGNIFQYDPVESVSNLPFSCASFNPGFSNTFLIDYKQNGNPSRVDLSAAEMGFDKAKRTYFAIDLFAEHPLRDGWYGKVTYTYSKNRGNMEGQTNSELGQADVAATVSWDHPELMANTYGDLPNDRRHQLKAYGFMQLTPEVQLGANLLVASGRPRNCLGNDFGGTDEFQNFVNYGSVYFYCGGQPAPRGSLGTLPTETRLDMNVVYRPAFLKGLAMRADVANVFNTQVKQNVLERKEQNYSTALVGSYERALSYSPERVVKFTVTYDKQF
ncbi:MAG: TonB-dependent receptor [Rubrivivax sp.]|nr:TonB-dependent receptor [Rubrivivax sp.]